MHKTKNTLLIIFAIVIVGCLLYVPGLTKLGLYRDDWNNFYNLTVRGPETLIKAYDADRPADGYLIAVLFRLFGTDIKAYFIWNLCCRILGSVFFALSLLIIWPRTPKMAALAGVLAVVFSGFLQQVRERFLQERIFCVHGFAEQGGVLLQFCGNGRLYLL